MGFDITGFKVYTLEDALGSSFSYQGDQLEMRGG